MKKQWILTEDGEANFYGIMDNVSGNWLMRIQINGDLYEHEQKKIAKLIENIPEILQATKPTDECEYPYFPDGFKDNDGICMTCGQPPKKHKLKKSKQPTDEQLTK